MGASGCHSSMMYDNLYTCFLHRIDWHYSIYVPILYRHPFNRIPLWEGKGTQRERERERERERAFYSKGLINIIICTDSSFISKYNTLVNDNNRTFNTDFQVTKVNKKINYKLITSSHQLKALFHQIKAKN